MQIGPYKISGELGRGGMSVVYSAVDVRTRKNVALKVLPPQHANDETFLRRFLREGKNAARLRHRNIVQIYESGHRDGHYYIAMELVNGTTLTHMLRKRGRFLAPDEIIPILQQVAAALDYAHQRGFLHRDVKLSNILITHDERVLLSDFGIAKHLSGNQTVVTRFGYTVGTPTYMSPEQARGARDIDQRSDIYSLGVVAYFMFTGQPPFQADSQPALLHKIVLDDPIDPRTFNPYIQSGLVDVLQRAMSKDPALRYRSARDFVAALNQKKTQTLTGIATRRPPELLADTLLRYFNIRWEYPSALREYASLPIAIATGLIALLVVLIFWLLIQSALPNQPSAPVQITPVQITPRASQPEPIMALRLYTDLDGHFTLNVPAEWSQSSEANVINFDADGLFARLFIHKLDDEQAAGTPEAVLERYITSRHLTFQNIQLRASRHRYIGPSTAYEQRLDALWLGKEISGNLVLFETDNRDYIVGWAVEKRFQPRLEPSLDAILDSFTLHSSQPEAYLRWSPSF